ncbi:MAG: hypothetical protein OXL41_14460 [Nitrospinae bacterium]|nr:hypothetical protein [Nitrospinota bacterium]
MSDGPVKSLGMPRHLRDLKERASNLAYSIDQVSEAHVCAVKKDFKNAPLSEVRSILGGGEQRSLSLEDRTKLFDALSQSHRGSVVAVTLIDCAKEVLANGMQGDSACEEALQNALRAHSQNRFHQIEEHHYREGSSSELNIRERLTDAEEGCSYDKLASQLMTDIPSQRDLRLPKRTGIDEGPLL